jgi:predicted nucleic acid-binding Zn ribbon protein
MVQTWKSKKGPDETCPKCGAIYSVTITRLPVRDSDYFDCEKCGHRMKEWNGTTSYNYELKK